MAYNKTEWIANQTLVSAENLNKIEKGIAEAHETLETLGGG